jgi:hypothetical protein
MILSASTWRWPHVPLLFILLTIIALAYWPGLGGGFMFDDFSNIIDNKSLHVSSLRWNDWVAAIFSSPATSLQRPLAMLTFALNHYFTGLDPVAMKLTNVAIHLVNTLLVFGLARSLLRALTPSGSTGRAPVEWAAVFTAAAWALHPINLMAVLFVVQRMESLCHTFVFAGLWLYVVGRCHQHASRKGWGLVLAGMLPFTLLGMLVKESAALLPLYALCLELCIFRFRDGRGQTDPRIVSIFVAVLALPALVGVSWLLPKSLAPGAFSFREFSLAERLMTEPRVVMDYLRWILWPDLGQLSLYHDDYAISHGLWNPPATLFGILGIAALLVGAWFCRRRRPLLALGVLWFLGAQLLTATFLPLELVFEHRNYFASLGICLALADLLLRAPTTGSTAQKAGAALALAFVLAYAGLTALRAYEWRSPVAFAVAEAAKHPNSPRSTYYLGWVLARATRYQTDSPLVQPAFQAFDRARALPNSNILPDQGALILAARTGTPVQDFWWRHMQERLRTRPIGPQELGALGGLVTCMLEKHCQFLPRDMLATFGAALSQGDQPEVLNIYANYVLNELGDPGLALRLWRQSAVLNPGEPQYRISAAKLLIALNRHEEARVEIARLRKMGRFGQYRTGADSLEARIQVDLELRRQGRGHN